MWFKEDKILNGFVTAFLATVACAFAILVMQRLLGIDILLNAKMYIFSVIGEIFIVRWHARNEKHAALKGSVLSLIVTFIAITVLLMKYNYVSLQG